MVASFGLGFFSNSSCISLCCSQIDSCGEKERRPNRTDLGKKKLMVSCRICEVGKKKKKTIQWPVQIEVGNTAPLRKTGFSIQFR